ncbi:sugar phosphate isomerase/epimerase family protein [Paenibacillus eucommiae]|uniref:Sugar phosphate isomerase/epimerase n=1 Tax=Paenibacillus eucommiae TaxID=1355755 RepID=A0ABS4J350_9BACL|nr:sugar phosphate isomerase/epimerase family protein [Paenibacillus eucommiae]MBP1994253.1 sugar phosphate isomerase/epimerase [Paenibacillus eucommiae]
MELGLLVVLKPSIREEIRKVSELGFATCQLSCWDESLFTDEMIAEIQQACAEYKVKISHIWCGWLGPQSWNLIDGPSTLGLVPEAYRDSRLQMLLKGADFTAKLGVQDMITHVGFIPEDPGDQRYRSLLTCLHYLAIYCKGKGIHFLFETGQETPVTLLRVIEDLNTGNLGINLDPANLILYGKGNPVDALDVFGSYVRGVHAKDGMYPTNGRMLGLEVPIGQGKVDFPSLVGRLKELGYEGPLTIEREIEGDEQIRDILSAKQRLEQLL